MSFRDINKPSYSSKDGVIYPFVYRLISYLNYLSLLTYVKKFRKQWRKSKNVVDSYVLFWLVFAIICWLCLQILVPHDGKFLQPPLLRFIIIGVAGYRLLDILLSWIIQLVPPLNAKAPRILVLIALNFVEVIFIFAIIGYLLHCEPYWYLPTGDVAISAALRTSFTSITLIGAVHPPETWLTGWLFYIQSSIGFFFFAVIVSVAISLLTKNDSSES